MFFRLKLGHVAKLDTLAQILRFPLRRCPIILDCIHSLMWGSAWGDSVWRFLASSADAVRDAPTDF